MKEARISAPKKKSTTKRILLHISRGSFGIVLFFVLLLSTIVIAQLFGVEFDTVVSPSMAPEIPVGSLVVTVPTDFSKIEVGDDVTYKVGSSNVTHRVIGTDADAQSLYTQGIANNTPDGAVSENQLVGKVALHIPLAGYVLFSLSTVKGKILAALIMGVLAVISVLLEKTAKSTI